MLKYFETREEAERYAKKLPKPPPPSSPIGRHLVAAHDAIAFRDFDSARWHRDQIIRLSERAARLRHDRDRPKLIHGPESPIGAPSHEHLREATAVAEAELILSELAELR